MTIHSVAATSKNKAIQSTLGHSRLAAGLTARSAPEKFAAVQMIDVHLPTTDGRELLLTRYTEPEPELQLLVARINLVLPAQPPQKITALKVTNTTPHSEDLLVGRLDSIECDLAKSEVQPGFRLPTIHPPDNHM